MVKQSIFKKVTVKGKKRDWTVNACIYIVHDPPVIDGGPKTVRSTTAAILFEDGTLFVGISTASESDIFTRKKGREEALAKAYQAVDAFFSRPHGNGLRKLDLQGLSPRAINEQVFGVLKDFQIMEYKRILSDRYRLLNPSKHLPQWSSQQFMKALQH